MGEENSFDVDQWRALAGVLFCVEGKWWNATSIAIRRNFGDINQQTKRGKSVMEIACRRGNLNVCKQLLSHPNLSLQDNAMYLTEAVSSGNIDILELLLADDRFDPSDGAALATACFSGSSDVIAVLLSDTRVDPSVNGNKALINACRNGHDEVVQLLLQDPRVDSSAQGNVGLLLACRIGHYKVVEMLLQHANVISPVAIHDCFARAIQYERLGVLEVLVNNPKTNHIYHIAEAFTEARRMKSKRVAHFLFPYCNL